MTYRLHNVSGFFLIEGKMERLSKVAANGKAMLIIGSLLAFIFAVVLNAVLNIPGISKYFIQ